MPSTCNFVKSCQPLSVSIIWWQWIHKPLECGWKLLCFERHSVGGGGDSGGLMIALPFSIKVNFITLWVCVRCRKTASHLISRFLLFLTILFFFCTVWHLSHIYRTFDRLPTTTIKTMTELQCNRCYYQYTYLFTVCSNLNLCVCVCSVMFPQHMTSETLHYFYTYSSKTLHLVPCLLIVFQSVNCNHASILINSEWFGFDIFIYCPVSFGMFLWQ